MITCTDNQAYRKSNDIKFSKAVSAYQLNDSDSSLKVITCIDNQAYGKNNNMTFSEQYNPVQPKADVSIYSEPVSVSNELVYNSAYFECNLHSYFTTQHETKLFSVSICLLILMHHY